MIKRSLQLIFGLAISVLFLWLAFRNADLSKVWLSIKTANIYLLIGFFFVSSFGLVIRSYRWRLLGEAYKGVPLINFFKAINIGLMLNIFLPFRGGDFFQSYFIAKKSKLSKSYTLSTVFSERLVDILPPMFMLIVGSFFVALPEQIKLSRVLMLLAIIIGSVYVFVTYSKNIIDFIENFEWIKHSEKLKRFIDHFAENLIFLKNRQVLAEAVPLTFLMWILVYNFGTLLLLWSLSIKINYWAVFLVQAIGVLSVAIPSSPGFVGTWEFFCMLGLGIFGVEKHLALSYAVLSHFMSFLPVMLYGMYFFLKEVVFGSERGFLKDQQQEN